MRRPGPPLAALFALAVLGHAAVTVARVASLDAGAQAANFALLGIEVVLGLFAALLVSSLRDVDLPAPPERAEAGAVDVLIPVRDEPPGVLRATLAAARAMQDPGAGFSLHVLDDSSSADAVEEVARACREHGAAHHRREARRGYKAGALNDAMRATRAPFVAVLDVDHQPTPSFLVDALRHMAPGVAFVQTTLEWRNDDSLLRRLAALLQHQFYHGVQREKGERERVVWTGSAAVFRRAAIEDVGGFPEDTLVEDFDMTLRLTSAEWRARLSPTVGARGLLPWTAVDVARQLWRWAHGTTEVVRGRALPTLRERGVPLWPRVELLLDGCSYLAGGTFVAAALLLTGMAIAGVPVVRPLAGWSILLAPALVALAHVATATRAMRARGGPRVPAHMLALYHLVSLAYTPLLLAAALSAWMGRGRGREGRVAKAPQAERGRGVVVATLLALALAGAALLAASQGRLPAPAAGWLAFLGAAYLSIPLVARPGRPSAPPAAAAPHAAAQSSQAEGSAGDA